MALENLQGLPTQGPYTEETVNAVKDLLNAGTVDVGEVSQYFNVDKSVILENLTGISPDAYTKDTEKLSGLTVENVDAIEALIQKGVASSGEIADYFNAPQSVVERHLTEVRGYNPTAIANAQLGGQIQDVNRFASYQSELGEDLFDPTAAPQIVGKMKEFSDYELNAEIANILNRSNSQYDVTTGLMNLMTMSTNDPEDVKQRIRDISGNQKQDIFMDDSWKDFNFNMRTRDYFGPEGRRTSGKFATGLEPETITAKQAQTLTRGGAGNALGSLGTQYATGSEIPTGLRGSEMALKGGAAGAISMLDELNRAGRGDLATQYAEGLRQAEAQADIARGDITGSYGRAEEMFSPYRTAGEQALQQQAALSGALGQDAFQQAYQESPYIQFLREQGMRANLAGAAATGGLGGGNVQKELQRFGQGLASQGLQQQIANLGALSGQGLSATGSAAGIATGAGTNLANIASALGGQQLATQTALGNQLAGYNLSTGLPAVQAISNLGTNLAAGRTRAGELLAQQYGQTAGQLGNIYTGQGRDIAAMIDAQRNSIMQQVQSGAMTEAEAQQALYTNLANLQSGIGSQLAGVPNAPIFSPDYGAQIGQAFQAGGIGAYISDLRGNNAASGGAPVSTSVGVVPNQPIGFQSNILNLPGF